MDDLFGLILLPVAIVRSMGLSEYILHSVLPVLDMVLRVLMENRLITWSSYLCSWASYLCLKVLYGLQKPFTLN